MSRCPLGPQRAGLQVGSAGSSRKALIVEAGPWACSLGKAGGGAGPRRKGLVEPAGNTSYWERAVRVAFGRLMSLKQMGPFR